MTRKVACLGDAEAGFKGEDSRREDSSSGTCKKPNWASRYLKNNAEYLMEYEAEVPNLLSCHV